MMIKRIMRELKERADPSVKFSTQRWFKEEKHCLGVRTPAVRSIAKSYWKEIKDKPKKEIFKLCEELLDTGLSEPTVIAVQWTSSLQAEESDFKRFEKWVENYVHDWASCDDFCLGVLSQFIVKFPKCKNKVKSWSKSKNMWKRRASAVSFIQGGSWKINKSYLKDAFDIADTLMKDKEDLVQKGFGWMLKVASQPHEKEVFNYVMKNKDIMPRTALRYAIEKMPKELKKKAMAK